MGDIRFLDFSYKQEILQNLAEEIALNKVDKEFIPYLELINDIDGVVTSYCCIGHDNGESYLMIYFSQDFYQKIIFEVLPYIWERCYKKDWFGLQILLNYQNGFARICFLWQSYYFKEFMDFFSYELLWMQEELQKGI